MSDQLLERARKAKEDAYAPYSKFSVGAAIRTESGDIYCGANVENINHTNTAHAEQNALHQAVLDGHRKFEAIAISLSGKPAPPCGLCRQSLAEFCGEDFSVIVDGGGEWTLGDLLPSKMEDIST